MQRRALRAKAAEFARMTRVTFHANDFSAVGFDERATLCAAVAAGGFYFRPLNP